MLKTLRQHLGDSLEQVEKALIEHTHSTVPPINTVANHCLKQGGKRIRPSIILLAAHATGYSGNQHITLATVIELIHAATLLHDDVIDHADTRRNQPTGFAAFGNTQSILMGDFVYACAFQLIGTLNSTHITHILAEATRYIVEGEIYQLHKQHQIDTSIDDYMQIISSKTARLFSVGTHCVGALVNQYEQPLKSFGHHFGLLYQMTDDILDIDVFNTQLDKKFGNDLKEGKMTLPIILAYSKSNTKDRQQIQRIICQQEDWESIIPILEKTDAIASCEPYLITERNHAIEALLTLPDTPHRQMLIDLTNKIPKRRL